MLAVLGIFIPLCNFIIRKLFFLKTRNNNMAKRSCPFVDYVRERKLYVTKKVMDRDLTKMQEVYEKTTKMLFDGASKNQDKNCNVIKLLPEILEDPETEENEELHKPQILRGQCQLDLTGRLIPYEKATWEKAQNERIS